MPQQCQHLGQGLAPVPVPVKAPAMGTRQEQVREPARELAVCQIHPRYQIVY